MPFPTGPGPALTWLYQMVQGPPGATGPTGPAGPTGPQGPTGAPGPSIPLAGELYVDPRLSADAFPYFKTIQAAINAVNTTAPNASRINLPGGNAQFTENLSFPDGASVELVSPDCYFPAVINGNLTDPAGANTPRAITLTNIKVNGSITLTGTGVFSFLSLTYVGGGGDILCTGDVSIGQYNLRVNGGRPGASASGTSYPTTYFAYGLIQGNITCGRMQAYNAAFSQGKTITAGQAEYNQCFLQGSRTHNVAITTLIMTSCGGAQTFNGKVWADDFSAGFAISRGIGIGSGGSYRLMNESFTRGPSPFGTNVAVSNLVNTATGPQPTGMYKVEASMNRLGEGSSGVAAFILSGVDESGAWSRTVCTMGCSTGSGDTRTSATVIVRSNGTVPMTYQISGVVGSGFSGSYEATVRRRDSQNS